MSEYLDISIERQTDDGWKHLMNVDYDDDLSIINARLLRDYFRDNGFSMPANEEDITPESLEVFSEKIYRDSHFPTAIAKTSKRYPYNYKCIEDLYSADDVIAKLQQLSESDNKYREVVLTFNEDETESLVFPTPYRALQSLKYDPDYAGKANIFSKDIMVRRFVDKKGNEVRQSMIKYGTEVSTYDDLKLFLRSIEKDLKNAEESRNDSKRLQALLRNELADVPKSEFKSELGKAVKHLMGKEHIVFDNEYIDELKAAIEELKFLIKIVAPNGRIIWNIS